MEIQVYPYLKMLSPKLSTAPTAENVEYKHGLIIEMLPYGEEVLPKLHEQASIVGQQ